MKIVRIKDIEDCFDGSSIKEILFDEGVTKEFVHYLGRAGRLQYFPSLVRPFFRIDDSKRYSIKGIEGNKTVRIVLYRMEHENGLNELKKLITNFRQRR